MGKRLISVLLAALAGGLIWAAFPDVGAWPLMLVGVGLLWYVLSRCAGKTVILRNERSEADAESRQTMCRPGAAWNALLGFIAGLAFFGPHVWWANVATAMVPWVALTMLQAAFWAALGALWAWTMRMPWVSKTPWRQALAFALLFTGVEQWRSSIPFGGFPWGRLAWTVAGATPGRAAWLGGSVFVTFLLTLAATLVAVTARDAYRARMRPGQYMTPVSVPQSVAQPGTANVKQPSWFQKLLRPELELMPDRYPVAAPADTEVVAAEPGLLRKRTQNILVPAHLKPRNVEVAEGSAIVPSKASGVTPDLRLVIGGLLALVLLAAPSWLPLAHDARATPLLDWTTVENATALPRGQWPDRPNWVNAGVATAEAGELLVGIAQGNVFNPGLSGPENAESVFRSHLDATRLLAQDAAIRATVRATPDGTYTADALPGFDLVVWPENSAAWDPNRWPQIGVVLDEYSELVEAPILVGSMEYPEYGGRYNVSLLWEAGQGTIGRYAKQIPAPFGEFIPFRTFARMLTDQVDRLPVDMHAATNPPVITWYVPRLGHEVTMGLGICFEVAYDHVFFDAVRQGAEFLVIPTNNASFGHTAQSTQQLQMTQMQAITTGRAAIQISTVGVSGVFTPDGQLVALTDLWDQDRISALIPLRTSITPAVRLGMAPSYLVQALALALPLAGLVFGSRKGRGFNTLDSASAAPGLAQNDGIY